MHPMLNTAIKAARRAGAIINRAGLDLERLNVARKGPKDYVTEVDRAAEESIIDILRTAYPDHGILAEESGRLQAGGGQSGAEFQWVIDPLDGTTNFIHGFAHYAVSIALMHRGQAAHAVVYDPTRNEMFTASRGEIVQSLVLLPSSHGLLGSVEAVGGRGIGLLWRRDCRVCHGAALCAVQKDSLTVADGCSGPFAGCGIGLR